ncbi:hypothetical protein FRC17_008211 [Serendipita sp. 399]|nr:hypothetical protein FRC17_008211 [Serendipita sp. 399]
MYVSIPTLHGLQEYARIIGAPYLTGRFPKDSLKAQGKASSRNTVDSHPAGALDDTERALLARRLCRTIHINIPTGNLTMIPSWSDIPVLTLPIQIPTGVKSSLDSLTHIIFTVKEPHPAFFAYLAGGLPSSVKVLDIHISSPYIYKRPVLNRASSNTREADLRSGLSHVNHLLINVLDPLLLACILEGFGSTYSEPSTSQNPQVVAILDEESKAAARRSQIYSSPSLQTLTLHGPHLLTHPTITDTISHSPTIHTLTLYPHAPKVPGDMLAPCNALSVWNAPLALQNEAWLPALERLVVRKPTPEARDEEELAKIKEVCEKRRVQVIVEGPSY